MTISALNPRNLQQVPAGLVVLRPTRFSFLRQEGTLYIHAPNDGDDDVWIVGRNAPLREVIAAAYNQLPARVQSPVDAPKRRFHFLGHLAEH